MRPLGADIAAVGAPDLEPCDIFFTRAPGWVARAIRWRTRRRGEGVTEVNHVGIVVAPGSFYSAEVVEALVRGARRGQLGEHYAGAADELTVFRPLNLTPRDREIIVARALLYGGRRYGVGKILAHLVGIPWLGRSDRWPICSFLVARAYSAAGYDFGVAPCSASPDDIFDFCASRPDRYALVRSMSRLPVLRATEAPQGLLAPRGVDER